MGNQKLSTKALHAGHDTSLTQGTRAVPLYQSTSYVFNNAEHAANLFALAEPGYIYTRLNNPTNDVLEQRLASLRVELEQLLLQVELQQFQLHF